MGSRRGLPQGLMPSDTLATLYLAELDFVMVRNGFRYVRHGDDVRIAAETYDRACRALRTLEATLRKLGLLLNVEKTRVLRRDTYARNVTARETIFDDAQERITSARVQNIRNNEHALETAIHDADMEQLGWDLFYHERIDLDAAIEELRPALTPTEVEVAEHVFLNAVENQPGTDHALERDTFHQRLAWSLVRLSAGRSHAGVVHVAPLMISYPEKVRMLCSYLSALASEQAFTTAVASQIEIALGVENTEWETALVVRVLRRMPMKASNNILSTLKSFLDSPHNRWLAAVEVAKLMAIRQELERDSLIQMWESCPLVLRADLVEAAAQMVRSAPWAKAFVESTRSDPIHEVVARHELHNE